MDPPASEPPFLRDEPPPEPRRSSRKLTWLPPRGAASVPAAAGDMTAFRAAARLSPTVVSVCLSELRRPPLLLSLLLWEKSESFRVPAASSLPPPAPASLPPAEKRDIVRVTPSATAREKVESWGSAALPRLPPERKSDRAEVCLSEAPSALALMLLLRLLPRL